jgi:hypothetical protein
MSEFAVAPGKLNVGAVISQAFATLQSKLLFFVFTGLMVGLATLVAVIVYQNLRAQVAGAIPAEQPETDGVPA